jgi:zinc transport system substrate-binding protein
MKFSQWLRLLLIGTVLAVPLSSDADSEPMTVTVSVLPLASMVQAIGGAHVDVNVMVPAGVHPRVHEPTPLEMAALESSALYLSMNLPRERSWLAQIRDLHPGLPILDLMTVVETRMIDGSNRTSQSARPDPHIWLGPAQLRAMGRAVRDRLMEIAPDKASEIAANADQWLARVDAADRSIRRLLAPYANRAFLAFHPAFGYFADAYGLRQIAIEQRGMDPGPRMIAATINRARAEGIRVVFVQAHFSSDSARVIASEIGGQVVKLDPLAADPIDTIQTLAEAIEEALG